MFKTPQCLSFLCFLYLNLFGISDFEFRSFIRHPSFCSFLTFATYCVRGLVFNSASSMP